MEEKKVAFPKGKIEIELVFDEKGKPYFLTRFLADKSVEHTYNNSDTVIHASNLVIGDIKFVPVAEAWTDGSGEDAKHYITHTRFGMTEQVEKGEFINLGDDACKL